jgi:membrane fusion protein, multidrug efflux system
MKKGLIYLVVLALLGAGGWWGYQKHRAGAVPMEIGSSAVPGQADAGPGAEGKKAGPGTGAGGSGQTGPSGGRGPGGPVGVEVVKVIQESITDETSAVGSLRANESVVIKPEFSGRIVSIGFTDGARVAKGAVLFGFDDSITSAELEQAKAELALAETNYKRTAELAQRNFVSSAALDQSNSQLKIQQARLQLVQARLDKLKLRAPFSGTLGLRNVSIGDFVKDAAELVVLEDTSLMKVDLRLPERLLGRLGKGQSIAVQIDALPGKTWPAKLEALDAVVDANGRSVIARGKIPNPNGVLRLWLCRKKR